MEYKWLKETGITEYYTLRNNDFSIVNTEFRVKTIDPFIKRKLNQNGIINEFEPEFFDFCHLLKPVNIKLKSINAPLYEYRNGTFELISHSFIQETLDPEQYNEIKGIYERCEREVILEQREVFRNLFYSNSKDGGITSTIDVIRFIDDPEIDSFFLEKYVPYKKFIRIFGYFNHDKNRLKVMYIRKIDAKGSFVEISVPDEYKGLAIMNGYNLKNIARQINSRMIIVK